MFRNLFAITYVLFHGATYSLGLECSKYYFLLEASHNDDLNSTLIDSVSEKINWDNYKININASELKDFNLNCVLPLQCSSEIHCVHKIRPIILHGSDERKADTTPVHETVITSSSDILNTKHMLNTNKTNLSNTTEKILQNNTKTTNNTEDFDKNVASKNESLKDSIPGVIKNNESTKHDKDDKKNETVFSGFDDPEDDILVIKKSESRESTTAVAGGKDNISDVEVFSTPSSHANKKGEMIDTVQLLKNTTEEKPQNSDVIAGKIAMGVLVAGVSVALLLLAKSHIIGCLQSGVYHIPDAC